MRDDIQRTDRVVPHQFRHRRIAGRLRVEKQPHGAAFEKCDAPAVTVDIRRPAARLKTGKRETDVRRDVTVHSKKFANDPILSFVGEEKRL